MLKILFFSLCLSFMSAVAEDHGHGHEEDHKKDAKAAPKESHSDHKDEHKEDDHKGEHKDEHGHEEEASAEGFKLTPNAIKNFELSYMDYKAPSITIPNAAIFRGLSEVNVYRLRNGFYKRVDFKTLDKNKDTITLSSSDLVAGDKIVVKGIGFLRIAEIAASGGISDSHSH